MRELQHSYNSRIELLLGVVAAESVGNYTDVGQAANMIVADCNQLAEFFGGSVRPVVGVTTNITGISPELREEVIISFPGDDTVIVVRSKISPYPGMVIVTARVDNIGAGG